MSLAVSFPFLYNFGLYSMLHRHNHGHKIENQMQAIHCTRNTEPIMSIDHLHNVSSSSSVYAVYVRSYCNLSSSRPFLNFMPHALHRVPGPSGPCLHCGVSSAMQRLHLRTALCRRGTVSELLLSRRSPDCF